MSRSFLIPLIASILLFAPVVISGEKDSWYEVVHEADVYYGDTSDFEAPAVCDVDKVYNKIPEYREIVERGMNEDNPRYLILLKAASEKFMTAVEGAAEDGDYDLVGALGSVVSKGKKKKVIPDITSQVIKKLPD